jgi:argonaute-like protein implicated in RNA metabolism and viral defense
MQVKRNQVVVVNYQNALRLALVRSVRNSTQQVNVMIHCYRNSSICSDWLIKPSDIVAVTDVCSTQFNALAKSYPNYAATDSISSKLFAQQVIADAQYPQYAQYRNSYEPRVAA